MTGGGTRRSLLAALALASFSAQGRDLAMESSGGAQYVCGGVGAEERRAMQALEATANLKLLFVTLRRGGYLADTAVEITDSGGAKRLRTTADGPICLLQLPAGRYRVSATFAGVTRTASVALRGQPGRPQQVALQFPAEPWDGIWASSEEKQQARE